MRLALFFPTVQAKADFAFQAACKLLASTGSGVSQTPSSLDILKSRLGLLNNEGTGYFDQIFGQAFSLLGRDHRRVVTR